MYSEYTGRNIQAEWKYSDVDEHWQQMKNLMMETAKDVSGMSKVHVDIRKHGGGMRRLMKQ